MRAGGWEEQQQSAKSAEPQPWPWLRGASGATAGDTWECGDGASVWGAMAMALPVACNRTFPSFFTLSPTPSSVPLALSCWTTLGMISSSSSVMVVNGSESKFLSNKGNRYYSHQGTYSHQMYFSAIFSGRNVAR
jgi:hypothetical protein